MTQLTPTPSPRPADLMLNLLVEARDIVTDLLALAGHQRRLIDNASTDSLLRVLVRRDELIEAFGRTKTQLEALPGDNPTRMAALDPARRAEAESLVRAIETGLDEIMRVDRDDVGELERRCAEGRSDMTGIDQSRRAHGAYGTVNPPASRYTDHRG